GKLCSLAEKRGIWLTLLKAVIAGTSPNLRNIHRRLLQKGIKVSYQTVLSWTRSPNGDDQAIPAYWSHFKALAEELHITLPEKYLLDIYNSIRRWRTLHRLAGRNLVRTMRNVYLGRLDSTALAQIEREWGLSTRELIQSTKLMEVDSILL